jgi:UDPglucose 6-dehydrogenase
VLVPKPVGLSSPFLPHPRVYPLFHTPVFAMAPVQEGLKICCIGAGYVGGPTMSMIAFKCPEIQVTIVDLSQARIDAWNSDDLPIYEPGLDKIVKAVRGKNLHFSTEVDKGIAAADIVFVAVNTPTKKVGIGAGRAADLTYWELAARKIAAVSTTPKIVVEKSTVPIKTAEAISVVLHGAGKTRFDVLSNPEFLAEGTAMEDLDAPDRVLIGGTMDANGRKACQTLADVYAHWIPEERILQTNVWSSELSKLVANSLLAQRVSSINAVSAICEASGADVDEVARAVGMDSRIGPKFLKASVGYGGSCFQKDILNLCYLCESMGLPDVANYFHQIVKMNDLQKERFVSRIIHGLFNTVTSKKIAVLGFAFKKDTGDTRETPAIDIVRRLVEEKAQVTITDPKCSAEQIWADLTYACKLDKIELQKYVTLVESPEEACVDAHAMVVATEWDCYKELDFAGIFSKMIKPSFVFDGRNILNVEKLRKIGFVVYAIGKPLDSRLNTV